MTEFQRQIFLIQRVADGDLKALDRIFTREDLLSQKGVGK